MQSNDNNDCGQFKPLKQLASIPLNTLIPERAVNNVLTLEERVDQDIVTSNDYFEIKDEEEKGQDWSSEFLMQSEKTETFPSFFEAAFNKLSFNDNNNWIQEYYTKEAGKRWINEYVNVSESNNEINEAKSWAEEFLDAGNEEEQLKEAAKNILSQLQNDHDPKLAKSRFMAYLKRLAGVEQQSNEWADQFSNNKTEFESNPEDIRWASMEKTWNKLNPTGYGYKNFASQSFGTYYFSDPLFAQSETCELKRQILLLESQLKSNTTNSCSKIWTELGLLQQANEMDPQAIAAFLKALQLDPFNSDALLGLASSCYNENCIPDALSAISTLIEHKYGIIFKENSEDPNQMLLTINQLISAGSNSVELSLVASILNCLLKNPEEAISHMKNVLAIQPNDWNVKNKLGALMANAENYNEALLLYDEIISAGILYPRVFFNQGVAYLCTDRYDQARKALETALSLQLSANTSTDVDPSLIPNYNSITESISLLQRLQSNNM